MRLTRLEVWQGVGVAFFGGTGMLFQLDGLAHTEASTSAFLTQASVIFIPTFSAIMARAWPAPRVWLCVGLALAGVAVLADFNPTNFSLGRGETETLISALFFTGHILWLERPVFRQNDATHVSLVMFSGITLLCFPLLLMQENGISGGLTSMSQWPAWVFLGVLVGPCSLMAFLWMNRWQRHVSATQAGLIYCLEPVFASSLALFLPAWFSAMAGLTYQNETLTNQLLLGGCLILLANVLTQWPRSTSTMNERAI
jgi:drug/metabolite transporter (DMT)-like permease